jgi:hypothetical protein
MENKVKAKYIKTEIWHDIIDMLVENQWRVVEKYDGFDVGIDYNRVVLEKDNEKIEFTWDNWTEGEILCLENRLSDIEKKTGLVLSNNPARRPPQQ